MREPGEKDFERELAVAATCTVWIVLVETIDCAVKHPQFDSNQAVIMIDFMKQLASRLVARDVVPTNVRESWAARHIIN